MFKRLFILPVVLALFATTTGCASFAARKGTLDTKYFAAITDWNTAKEAATIAVGNPSVPISVGEKIVKVMKDGDAILLHIQALRAAGTFEGGRADIALKSLQELRKQLVRMAVTSATGSGASLHVKERQDDVAFNYVKQGGICS